MIQPPPSSRYSSGICTVTLTTDFGTSDWFVGTMKGVILRLAPETTVVDLAHGLAAGDIRAGAFALMSGCPFFPKGTVHVAVVDPGVGSARRAIVVQTANYHFVGPDNGVLSFALRREKIRAIHQLANEAFFLKPVSRTFHGRDIFAPVAAHLSRGLSIKRLGPPVDNLVRLDWPQPSRVSAGCVQGEIVCSDRFGNLITNLDEQCLGQLNRAEAEVFTGRRRLGGIREFYQSVPAGQIVAVFG